MLRWLIGIILGEIICESSNWQHIQRLKITILGANWQLFRLERIVKCSYFILSTQNIKFHWIVMKIKKFLLPIWWYNRDLFPLRNKYNVFVLNGLKKTMSIWHCVEKCNKRHCWILFPCLSLIYGSLCNIGLKYLWKQNACAMLCLNEHVTEVHTMTST